MFNVYSSSKYRPSVTCPSDANVVCSLVSSLAYSSTLKMEATYSSEISVDFHRTARHYVPGDRTLHSHHYENFRSNNLTAMFTAVHSFLLLTSYEHKIAIL
jgi:hypothetical protein